MKMKMKMKMNPEIRYFIYARKSSEGEDRQVASIPAQLEELKKLAHQYNLKVVDVFIEEKSAKEPGRPIFNDMLSQIHQGKAQGIICWKLDRLARNPVDGGNINWMLQQNVIKHIQTYQRSYYPTDNVLMMNLEFGMANQYIIDLSVNVKRGQRQKLDEGWLPCKPPLGYLNNKYQEPNKKPIYKDEKRFNILKHCWKLIIEKQYSVNQARKVAHDMGLRTQSGNTIAKSQFHYIFKNPFYYGYFLWNDELYEGKHDRMISKQEFDFAQKIISGKYRSTPNYKAFPFTGLIRCAECGAMVTAEHKVKKQKNGNTHHYTYYHCTKQIKKDCSQKSIREEDLNQQLSDLLGSIEIPEAFHNWAMKALKEETEKEKTDRNDLIKTHEDSLSLINRKMDTLLSMRINNEIESEEFTKRKNMLLEEKAYLMELLSDSQNRANTWLERADNLFSFAKTAKARFETGTITEKKEIIQALGSNLLLKDKNLFIKLSPPFEILKALSPEVHVLNSRLEPVLEGDLHSMLEVEDSRIEKWLGRLDSNQRWRDQNPVPCRLATPQ